jgi:PAS domain S-box-containing protein
LLQQSTNLLRESQEVARLGHYVFDALTGSWESSDILDSIFGIAGDYPKNVDAWLQIVHQDQRDEMSAYFSQVVLGQGQPFDREYRITRVSDQQVRWVHGLGRLEFDKEGKPIRMIGTIQDITERKKAEEKLVEYQHQLRSLASELIRAEEEARRQIAVDLHDKIAQDLALTKMKTESLFDELIDTEYSGQADEIIEMLIESIKDVSSSIFELSPTVLYEFGLDAAIEWLAKDFEKKSDISCQFNGDGQSHLLSKELQMLLFRSIRELLVNVRKHADAKRVSIISREDSTGYRITIEDDGVGFEPSSISTLNRSSSGGGFGLFSIIERLDYQGGSSEIESRPKEGTKITLTIPKNKMR